MRLLTTPAAALAFAMLASCGGGGTSPAVPPTSGAASSQPLVANTALSTYLPLGRGNVWTFSTRGHMVDAGTFRLNCTCPYPHGLIEEIDVFDGAAKFGGSLFFSKQLVSNGTIWTTLIGVRTPGSNIVTLLYDLSHGQGLPVIDDAPFAGETWTVFNGPQPDAISTILSVAGTMPIGSQVLINVAQTRIVQPAPAPAVFVSFARGTGFSQVTIGPRTAALTSFSVNVSLGGMPLPNAVGIWPGRIGHPDVSAVLVHLLI